MRPYLPGTSHERRDSCGARYHDTYSAYKTVGCCCPAAKEDHRLYVKRLTTGRAHVQKIPAWPVVRRLRALRDRGHSSATIAVHAQTVGKREINRLLNKRSGWVRFNTAAAVNGAWVALKDYHSPAGPVRAVPERWGLVDAVDHSGRSAAQVAALTGLSVRTVKRRRTARRTAAAGQVAA